MSPAPAIMLGPLMPEPCDRAIRTLDLFAGGGGLTTGLSLARGLKVDPVSAVEFDLSAAATYTLNHGGRIEDGRVVGGTVYAGRIQDWLQEVEPLEVDLVVGGPPCQGFSTLGKQDVDDDRNFLWRRYAEAVKRSTPKFFVLENVPAFLTSPQWAVFQSELQSGVLTDYKIEFDILNAADYGAVQARKRVIVIGHHKDLPAPGLPRKTHEPQHRTLDEIFQHIPNAVDRVGLPEGTVTYGGVDRPGAFSTRELHFGRFYTDLSLKRFASIPAKGNRFDLPDELLAPCWRKHRTGTADVMGRLHLDKPSVTIRTEFFKPEKGRYLHPTEDRAITHYEAAMIQGFPEDYQWVGTREEIARQIGNAVPIPLGMAIGCQIHKAFSGCLEAPEEAETSRAA
ncbi:DNA cytosine methyltransferase [Propioniciclava tarda]|nr:DNA cytosine methyltransferase [Propioniciclava tarda]